MTRKLNRHSLFSLLTYLLVLICGCRNQPALEEEKKKLLALHLAQQDAHLNKNASQFVDQFADSMLSVNRGNISAITKDSAIRRYQAYFGKVNFRKWEDTRPPVIEFSKDASMAYMVVNKRVELFYKDSGNTMKEESVLFAWVSIFKKQENGDWKIVCNVSTNE